MNKAEKLKNNKKEYYIYAGITLAVTLVLIVATAGKDGNLSFQNTCDSLDIRIKKEAKTYFNSSGLPEVVGDSDTVTVAQLVEMGLITQSDLEKIDNECTGTIVVTKTENDYQYSYDLSCGTCVTNDRYSDWSEWQEEKPEEKNFDVIVETKTLYNYAYPTLKYTDWTQWYEESNSSIKPILPKDATIVNEESEYQLQYSENDTLYKWYTLSNSASYYNNGALSETSPGENYLKDSNSKTFSRYTEWSENKPVLSNSYTYDLETKTQKKEVETQYLFYKTTYTCAKYAYYCDYKSTSRYKCYKRDNLKCPCVTSKTPSDTGAVYSAMTQASADYENMGGSEKMIFLNYYYEEKSKEAAAYNNVVKMNYNLNGNEYICKVTCGETAPKDDAQVIQIPTSDTSCTTNLNEFNELYSQGKSVIWSAQCLGGERNSLPTSIVCTPKGGSETITSCIDCNYSKCAKSVKNIGACPAICCEGSGLSSTIRLNFSTGKITSCDYLTRNIKYNNYANKVGFKYLKRLDSDLHSSCPSGYYLYPRIASDSTALYSPGAILRNEYCTFDKNYKGYGATYVTCDDEYPFKEYAGEGSAITVSEEVNDYGVECKANGGTVRVDKTCKSLKKSEVIYLKKNGTTTTDKSKADYMTLEEYNKLSSSKSSATGFYRVVTNGKYDSNVAFSDAKDGSCQNNISSSSCKQTTMYRAKIYSFKWIDGSSAEKEYWSGGYSATSPGNEYIMDYTQIKSDTNSKWQNATNSDAIPSNVNTRTMKRTRYQYLSTESSVLKDYVSLSELEKILGKSYADLLMDQSIKIKTKIMYRYRSKL